MANITELLRQIQEDAVSSTVPVSEILRRCQVLAARLRIAELDLWVRHELNGYPDDAELPDYRILAGVARGHFSGYGGKTIRNAVLPSRNLPQKHRHWARQAKLRQPIAALQEMTTAKNDIVCEWPGDLIAMVQHDFYQYMVLNQAWLSLSRSDFVSAVETVRNRILSFALDAENYITSQETDAELEIPQQHLSQVFHTIIYGNVGNLAQGSDIGSQQSGVLPGDLSTLIAELVKIEVPPEDVKALENAISCDGNTKLGTNVSTWMATMTKKAADGAWSVALATATTILPKLLLRYYGLDSK